MCGTLLCFFVYYTKKYKKWICKEKGKNKKEYDFNYTLFKIFHDIATKEGDPNPPSFI